MGNYSTKLSCNGDLAVIKIRTDFQLYQVLWLWIDVMLLISVATGLAPPLFGLEPVMESVQNQLEIFMGVVVDKLVDKLKSMNQSSQYA